MNLAEVLPNMCTELMADLAEIAVLLVVTISTAVGSACSAPGSTAASALLSCEEGDVEQMKTSQFYLRWAFIVCQWTRYLPDPRDNPVFSTRLKVYAASRLMLRYAGEMFAVFVGFQQLWLLYSWWSIILTPLSLCAHMAIAVRVHAARGSGVMADGSLEEAQRLATEVGGSGRRWALTHRWILVLSTSASAGTLAGVDASWIIRGLLLLSCYVATSATTASRAADES
jgi:hypothetical protein